MQEGYILHYETILVIYQDTDNTTALKLSIIYLQFSTVHVHVHLIMFMLLFDINYCR